jgi:hypothetical protein
MELVSLFMLIIISVYLLAMFRKLVICGRPTKIIVILDFKGHYL